MRLAIIGDIHLFTLKVHPRRLLSRRFMAHSNLLLNRRHRFNHGLLPGLVEHAQSLNPDLVLFSGDVSTSSLESEFEDVMHVVKPLVDAAPQGGVLVPGNHDRYTFKSRRTRRIENVLQQVMPPQFPHARQLRPGWRLLALDSAIPNKLMSRGALGKEQFAAARQIIRDTPADEALLVLCHYPCSLPPRVPSAWSHDLKENVKLRRELMNCPGRVVFVHGHIHKPWHVLPKLTDEPTPRDGPGREPTYPRPAFECLNAGSPCMTSEKFPLGQGFWHVDLPEDPHAPLPSVHHVPLRPDGTDRRLAASAPGQIRWVTGEDL
jgi:3',5'-cyclic AMP phosphodiesterase CpdA